MRPLSPGKRPRMQAQRRTPAETDTLEALPPRKRPRMQALKKTPAQTDISSRKAPENVRACRRWAKCLHRRTLTRERRPKTSARAGAGQNACADGHFAPLLPEKTSAQAGARRNACTDGHLLEKGARKRPPKQALKKTPARTDINSRKAPENVRPSRCSPKRLHRRTLTRERLPKTSVQAGARRNACTDGH